MIENLGDLPEMTRRWLAPLKAADPELYGELAGSLVIDSATDRVAERLPAGVSEALSRVDLRGKEIGALRFAPAPGDAAVEQITAYDERIRQDNVEGGLVFVGEFGAGNVFVSPQGVGLLDPIASPPRIRAFSKTFSGFLMVQANAYDAYKRFIVKAKDEAAYQAAASDCAAIGAFLDADAPAIFDTQLHA